MFNTTQYEKSFNMFLVRLFVFAIAALLLVGCRSSKKITHESIYFKDISVSVLQKTAIEYEPVLQKGDILSIVVITPNENSSRLFNRPNASEAALSSQGSASTNPGLGYLVDEKGN